MLIYKEALTKEAEFQCERCLCEFKSVNYACLLKAISRRFEITAVFVCCQAIDPGGRLCECYQIFTGMVPHMATVMLQDNAIIRLFFFFERKTVLFFR